MANNHLPRKVASWPQDWDIHILNVCDLYFTDVKSVNFINGASFYSTSVVVSQYSSEAEILKNMNNTGSEVRLLFNINNSHYGASLHYKSGKVVKCKVFYLIKSFIDINDLEQEIRVNKNIEISESSHSVLLIQVVKQIESTSAFGCIEKVENIILEDYKDRGGGEEGGSKPEDSPDPVDVLDINPELVKV